MGLTMKRINRVKPVAAVCGLLLLLSSDAPAAESPEDAFKSLFGQQIRKVSATSTFTDDVKLAAEIVEVASSNKLSDELLTVMYNTAFGLASRSASGHATAFEAMDRLAGSVPAQEIKCRQKTLPLHVRRLQKARTLSRRQAAAGPYVGALMKIAKLQSESGNLDSAVTYARKALAVAIGFKLPNTSRIRAESSRLLSLRSARKRRELLEKKLKSDPSDNASRKKLVEIHLVDLDDPAGAAKLLNADSDELCLGYLKELRKQSGLDASLKDDLAKLIAHI